jgi:hypothetical protein
MSDFDKFYIYCDESSTSDRFTVIGALICRDNIAPRFTRWLQEITARHGGTSEVKWQKCKKHNLPLYKEFSSAFFKARAKNYAQFYAIVIDNSSMNHQLYNEGDKEIGFNKMLFQILYKMIRIFRQRPRLYAYLDDRTTKHTPERLRRMLNAKAEKDLGISHRPYRVCQFRKSHEEPLIQLVDVITGAIAYSKNGKDMISGAAPPKVALMKHIAAEAKVYSLSIPTGFPSNGFDIWHIDLKKYARGVRRT